MINKRILVVEDQPVQYRGIRSMVEAMGTFEIDRAETVQQALQLLDEKKAGDKENMYSMVMSDMSLPEEKGREDDPWAGSNLLLRIYQDYGRDIKLVLYTCKGRFPNSGDMQLLRMAGASTLWGPTGVKEDDFLDNLRQVMKGNLIIHSAFVTLDILAADPESRCPLHPVEYYCTRLIAENRGKQGAAEKWSRERNQEVSAYMIDDLLEEIYGFLSMEYEDFDKLSNDHKPHRLSTWYYDRAIPKYGAALPVDYLSKGQRARRER